MKYFIGIIIGFLLGIWVVSAVADSTWVPSQFVSSQYVLNKVFDSTNNCLNLKGK